MTANYIKTDGTIEEISPANGRDFSLSEVQELVHGLIDVVNIPDSVMIRQLKLTNFIFIVNDEGILLNMEQNLFASYLCSLLFGQPCALFGDVVFCHTDMLK